MEKFFDTLIAQYGRCPPACNDCVDACAKVRAGGKAGGARIGKIPAGEDGRCSVVMCVQCSEPECAAVCPVGAISRSGSDGTVRIDEARCVGCALCTLACPYGGIIYDPSVKRAFKCDRCDGAPVCVSACKEGVISFLRTSAIRRSLRTEDPFINGSISCAGCPQELALRTAVRVLGEENLILFAAPGCGAALICGQGTRAVNRIPSMFCLMGNVPSTMTGAKRYFRKAGRDVRVLAFVGDGTTGDVGFQALSGAAERGENLLYICYDNEGLMNTGGHRSGTTPYLASTYTSPVGRSSHGKREPAKNVPLLVAFHGVPYVATASLAYLEDYIDKVKKAGAVRDGLAYIHVLSPCPTGWRAGTDSAMEISRLAVETNFFPLWEAENSRFRLTVTVEKPRPVRHYTQLMGRFDHLTEVDLEALQRVVDAKYGTICALASL